MGSVFFKKFKITGSLTCPEPPVCPLNEEDYDELIKVLREYKIEKLDRDDLKYSDFMKPRLAFLSLNVLIKNL